MYVFHAVHQYYMVSVYKIHFILIHLPSVQTLVCVFVSLFFKLNGRFLSIHTALVETENVVIHRTRWRKRLRVKENLL